jgi:glutathione S-transferase
MSDGVTLYGYRFSVYTRVARMVLEEKGVAYDRVEVDPFAERVPEAYRRMHPFARVPVLRHGDFTVYETVAIARYIDVAFVGPSLTPRPPRAAARLAQVVAIVDSYGYWPMVRQVFAHRVFRPYAGETPDEREITAGLKAAGTVLAALDAIAAEGEVLHGRQMSLADCHLAPMIAYFAATPEGADLLAAYAALAGWWNRVVRRKSLIRTDPWQTDPGRPAGLA